MKRSLTLVPLVLLALAAPSLGQEPKEPAAPPTPGGLAGLTPDAKALLEKSAAAYRKLTSYQSDVVVHLQAPQRTTDFVGKFLVQRPLRARFAVIKGTPKRTSVSNGISIFRFVDGEPTYEKMPILPGANLATVLEQVGGLSFPIVSWLLSDPNPLAKIVVPGFSTGTVGKPVSLDGSVSDEIEFAIAGAGGVSGTARIAIDRGDHLIRRVAIEQVGAGGQAIATQTEEYRRVTMNPELVKAAFGFSVPEGVVLAGSSKALSPAPARPSAAIPTIPALPKNAKTVKRPDGLELTDIKVGEGKECPAGATVTVHYTGWLPDGTKFDSSVDRGQPATFPLNGVVKGWGLGIPGMKIGGKRRLTIPPTLGYGERGTPGGPIPPNATLIFDVELIEIK